MVIGFVIMMLGITVMGASVIQKRNGDDDDE